MSNKEYIIEPRVLRTEAQMHQERIDFSECPMGGDFPCNESTNVAVFPRDTIEHPINYELMRQIHEPNLLNINYFSKRNRDNVHNAIRRHVYELSEGKYLIARQSDESLCIIMRYIYVENSRNSMTDIRGQIEKLNNLVLEEVVPKILSNIHFYHYFLKDKFTERKMMELPQNVSTYGTKTEPVVKRV